MKSRAQSAIEFLSTYGWAILVVLLLLAALYYFGVFDTSRYTPRYCSLPPGFECTSFKLMKSFAGTSMQVVFSGYNGLGYDIGFANGTAILMVENLGAAGAKNYTGTCSPSIVRKGRAYTCLVNITDMQRVPSTGEVRRMDLLVTYANCETDPNYAATHNCPTALAQNRSLTGEIITQMEPYLAYGLCGNGQCDDNLGETNVSCPQDCNKSARTIVVVSSPGSIPADGGSNATLTATVYDQFNNLLPSALVMFSKDVADCTLSPSSNTTNSSGQASVRLTAGTSQESVIINASSGGASGITVLQLTAYNVSCGDTIYGSTSLMRDLSFAGSGCCIRFGADNIFLDGTNHKISGDNTSGGMAVCATNRTNVTVRAVAARSVDYGINFDNTNSSLISNCTVTGASMGVYLTSSSRNRINRTISSNNSYGFQIGGGSNYNNLTSTVTNYNTNYGIWTCSTYNISATNHTANWNQGVSGVEICLGGNHTFANCNVSFNSGFGIDSSTSPNNKFTGNTVNNNTDEGFNVISNSNNLTGNTASGNGNKGAIYLTGSNCIVANNNLTRNPRGIYADGATYASITGNNASINTIGGIVLNVSNNNTIANNVADLNLGYAGILLDHCLYNNLTNNTAGNNSQQGIAINPLSNWSRLVGNTARFNSQHGIVVGSSHYNFLTNNTAYNNTQSGIYVGSVSQYNNLTWNNCSNNSAAGIASWNGAVNYNDFNLYAYNNLTKNNVGLSLSVYTSFNSLTGNNITNSTTYGVSISSSNNALASNRVCYNPSNDFQCGGANNSGSDSYDTNSGCGVTQAMTCAGWIPISGCTTLSTVGGKYFLTQNINFAGAICCLNITADNVTLNGSSKTVKGDNTAGYANDGVCANARKNLRVENITVMNTTYGIYFNNTNSSTIKNNTLYLNNRSSPYSAGAALWYSYSNNVTGNNVSGDYYGVYLLSSGRNNISGNIANNNAITGIALDSVDCINNTINGNIANYNYWYGVLAVGNGNNITSNNCSYNNYDGIHFSSDNDSLVYNNIATFNSNGIYLNGDCFRVNMSNNNCSFNNRSTTSDGMYAVLSGEDWFANNVASNNSLHGIELQDVDNSTIAGNTANGNGAGGIYIVGGGKNLIFYNIANYNLGTAGSFFNAHAIILRWTVNNTVTGNTVKFTGNSRFGMYLDASNYNNLTSNIVTSNYQNIYISNSIRNRVISNTLLQNSSGTGLYLNYSNYTLVQSNNVNAPAKGGNVGINLQNSDYNNISSNNASKTMNCIALYNSTYNRVTSNICDSGTDGLYLYYSSRTTAFGNSFTYDSAYGIRILYSNYSNITNNNATSNAWDGIYLGDACHNILSLNRACNNTNKDFECVPVFDVSKNNTGSNIYDTINGCNITQTANCAGATKGWYYGRITNEGYFGLSGGVTVTNASGVPFNFTDSDGYYIIYNMTPGTYQLRADKTGYTSNYTVRSVSAGAGSNVDFILFPTSPTPPPPTPVPGCIKDNDCPAGNWCGTIHCSVCCGGMCPYCYPTDVCPC